MIQANLPITPASGPETNKLRPVKQKTEEDEPSFDSMLSKQLLEFEDHDDDFSDVVSTHILDDQVSCVAIPSVMVLAPSVANATSVLLVEEAAIERAEEGFLSSGSPATQPKSIQLLGQSELSIDTPVAKEILSSHADGSQIEEWDHVGSRSSPTPPQHQQIFKGIGDRGKSDAKPQQTIISARSADPGPGISLRQSSQLDPESHGVTQAMGLSNPAFSLTAGGSPVSPAEQIWSGIQDSTVGHGGVTGTHSTHRHPENPLFLRWGDHRVLRVSLIPRDLGEVEVILRRSTAGLKVSISVDNEATASLLKADVTTLTERLSTITQGSSSATINIEVKDQGVTGSRTPQSDSLPDLSQGSYNGSMAGMNRKSSPDKKEVIPPLSNGGDDSDESQTGIGIDRLFV